MQIFIAKTNHIELRMAAIIVLFESKPSTGVVTMLATVLLKEENRQVFSFVYSYIRAMTKSITPDHASL